MPQNQTTYRLIKGDCLEVMHSLLMNGESFSHVMADPPYESHMHKVKAEESDLRQDGYASPKSLDFGSIDGIRMQSTVLMSSLCSGWMLIFCTPEGVAAWRDEIEANEVKYKRACVWVKPDAAPQFNGQGPAMGAEMIVTAWAGQGHSKWNGGGKRGVFTHNTNGKDRHGVHPTEKPLSLMKELIELFTNPGDTILDPFMGSGTTGVACALMGRSFVGIEQDDKYFAIAKERIDDAATRPSFFHTPPEPKQADIWKSGKPDPQHRSKQNAI